jgi:DNA-binding beta-propeller fold protein YncE
MRIRALAAAAVFVLAAVPTHTAEAKLKPTRQVLTVGNNWDGTADLVDPRRFTRLAHINIVPDLAERMAEIQADPVRYGYFLAIRQEIGEGHDQLVDDAFTSLDGRYLYVSRPSLADVVAISLRTHRIVWRTRVEGNRSDHMALSPDGRHLLVSASTARKVQQLDTSTGKVTGSFESGDQPHESNYSRDGKLIYHASIGTVFTPLDDPIFDATKGDRWFEVVDATTLQVLKRIKMGDKLAEAGYPNMSSAVRPMALAPDEKTVYFQLSFLHGFVEYDLVNDRVLRVAQLPLSDEAARKRRDEYLLDSAHHGLAINPQGTKLCVAGTMSDYAAIVDRATFAARILPLGVKPYWATNSADGRYCFVSFSGDDRVSVISYAQERQVASIPVGDHPQRMRMGVIRRSFVRQRQLRR